MVRERTLLPGRELEIAGVLPRQPSMLSFAAALEPVEWESAIAGVPPHVASMLSFAAALEPVEWGEESAYPGNFAGRQYPSASFRVRQNLPLRP